MISSAVLEQIEAAVGAVKRDQFDTQPGGDINRSFQLQTVAGERYFIKLNQASALFMFEAEQRALRELAAAKVIRVPNPVLAEVADEHAFLLLEYIELQTKTPQSAAELGHSLALLHQQRQSAFGWPIDNTIGLTLQRNTLTDNWVEFWCEQRLGYQLQLAEANGLETAAIIAGQKLQERLPKFFTGYAPVPSLLHGDLWGGNWGTDSHNHAVIYDPATYYGDREADIAMTRLFGGFGPEFYAAYEEVWPLDAGFQQRCDLYNLYHVLNHFNLFGGGYRAQTVELLNKL